jgi:hypothetical protein
VVGLGLLLAVAATIGPPPLATGGPGGSLAIHLPDAVRAIVFGLLALSALLLLALQRPRRPSEEELQQAPMQPRRSAWVAALLPLLPLALLALAWYFIAHRGDGHPIAAAITALGDLMDLIASARKSPTSVPLFDYTIAILALLLALGIFALAVLVALAGPLEKWWTGRTEAAGAPVAADRADGPDDLRSEPDPRAAILRAYGRFERVLAAARHPRAPWQTPAEFRRTTMARLTVPARPVERLTGLFELARFSDHPVSAEARDTACDCLDEIAASLEADRDR